MIYFLDGEKAKNLTELITIGFSRKRLDDTKYLHALFRSTYKDPKLKIQQCHYARRSFIDLYEIATTYFPATTQEELAYILLNNIPGLRVFKCCDIYKFVFTCSNNIGAAFYFVEQTDQYYNTSEKDITGISIDIINEYAKNYKHL